ncbi:MAG: serine/threonine-protein kinase [Candidatus Obscuribacter sp.]|nr:serine/threonine-protein kinase [Candidatus Obscuribacter sp.]
MAEEKFQEFQEELVEEIKLKVSGGSQYGASSDSRSFAGSASGERINLTESPSDFASGERTNLTEFPFESTNVPGSSNGASGILPVGTVVDGKYEILALVGSGGMGRVYLAKQKELGTKVALKVLHRHLLDSPNAAARFKQEARAAFNLSSRNLVSVLDFGQVNQEQPYLAMQFVEGVSLQDFLKTNGPMSFSQCILLLRQVSAALEEAHSMGIVHRDIKPSNILLSGGKLEEGSVKVVDFGIAKGFESNESSIEKLTSTGQLIGSPLYMSPEQVNGTNIDARSDLYSLGCVMFECLTGTPPFRGETVIQTLIMHCKESPPSLKVDGKDSAAFADANSILSKLLAKEPEQRYSGAASLMKELERVGSDDLSGFSPARSGEETGKEKGDKKEKDNGNGQGKGNAGGRKYLAIATVVALLLSLAVVFFVKPFDSSKSGQLPPQAQRLSPEMANARLEELYKLSKSDDVSNTEAYKKNMQYLQEAIALSKTTFGPMGRQAAESYNRLGRHIEFGIYDESSDKMMVDAFNRAIAIAEYLKAHPGELGDISLPELNKCLQRYLFDRASCIAQTSSRLKGELFARAFALGALPDPDISQGDSYLWWNAYSMYLLDQGQVLDSARIRVQMHTSSKVPLPPVEALSKQANGSLAGTYYFQDKRLDQANGEFRLNLRVNGDEVEGRYAYQPGKGSSEKAIGNLNAAKPDFQGTFKDGHLLARISFADGFVGEYAIVRVGPYLSLSLVKHWDTGKNGEHRHPYYFPAHEILIEDQTGK